MRSEITFTPPQMLGERKDYISDKDGSHKEAGIEVVSYCIGVDHPDDLFGVVKRLAKASKCQRGARRKHIAWEITLHPTDANGAKYAFRSREEMRRAADEVLKEFSAKYAFVGLHGFQDIHVLILNWGVGGLALKSYLPNRSNPRRVLVAVADRIEAELNIDRARAGVALLIPMKDVREKKLKERGRPPLHDEIARHLSLDKEPSVADILEAIAGCGWQGMIKSKKVFISFTVERPSSVFELDLFHKGVVRAWLRNRAKEKERKDAEVVPYELLIRALIACHQGSPTPQGIEKWLRHEDTNMVEQPILQAALLKDSSTEKDEYVALRVHLSTGSKEDVKTTEGPQK